jgi:hypothetical protein
VICEYDEREQYRRDHVFEVAASQRLQDHMRREREQGLHTCKTFAEYQIQTGVTVTWLADLMRHDWENDEQCGHCETVGRAAHWHAICPVIEGIPDLGRMTIDRTNRKRLLARDNLTLMCLSGNVAKSDTDEEINAIRNAYWRLHNASRPFSEGLFA